MPQFRVACEIVVEAETSTEALDLAIEELSYLTSLDNPVLQGCVNDIVQGGASDD